MRESTRFRSPLSLSLERRSQLAEYPFHIQSLEIKQIRALCQPRFTMKIPVAFATYDQCLQERDGSMSYNVQAAFLSEGFFRRPGHLPNIPEGWNNIMKKARRRRYGGKSGKRTRRSLKREGKEVVEIWKRRQPALELKTMRVACSI